MVPSVAHFIWFGRSFPYIYGLALRSASAWGGLRRVVLHHADPIDGEPGVALALEDPAVTLRPLDPEALLARAGQTLAAGSVGDGELSGAALVALFRRLTAPAARANLVRAALLYVDGGVYLDTDTVTVRPMAPLLKAGAFCGEEPLCLPGWLVRSRNPARYAQAGFLLALRDGLRRLPRGYRLFGRVEPLYFRGANNAVLGAAPGHPLLAAMLRSALAMEPRRQTVRYALGTHLLESEVARYAGEDLVVHPPAVFYPLGPELSQHWFRRYARVEPAEVLLPETRVVHWYASVRTRRVVPRVDAGYVASHARTQLFSALVAPLLEGRG